VNTAEAVGDDLVLGGDFYHINPPSINIIKWNADSGFKAFANGIYNEVMDIQRFKDTLYAACKQTSTVDSILLQELDSNSWTGVDLFADSWFFQPKAASFNTLSVLNDTLTVCGDFGYTMFMSIGSNTINVLPPVTPFSVDTWMNVDSAINKTVIFKNRQVSGGRFDYNLDWPAPPPRLNGIAVKKTGPNSIAHLPGAKLLNIYPNPAVSGSSLVIENDFSANLFTLYDVNGKPVISSAVKNGRNTLPLPSVAAGSYFAELSNAAGETKTKQLIIK
jgi:hypothetical protein